MTKNTIGGKGHKKSKKLVTNKISFPLKEDGCDYAHVTDLLGNGWLRVQCLGDNKERLGHIRGSMYKKVWIGKEDVVLVSLRGFQDNKCDIIHKYEKDDVSYLKKNGHIPDMLSNKQKDEEYVVFEDTPQSTDFDIDDI